VTAPRLVLAFLLLPCLLVPAATGHPPSSDPSHACAHAEKAVPGVPSTSLSSVTGVLGYLDPTPGVMGCLRTNHGIAWASHADACPALPFEGPVAGAYCGPLVAAGATATCTWAPAPASTTPTVMLFGLDWDMDGYFADAILENPVFGPVGPGAWTVTNIWGDDTRLIAFPTVAAGSTVDPLATTLVTCATP